MDESDYRHHMSAIIDAARTLVHKHVRSEIQHNAAMGVTALRVEITPSKGHAFVRYFTEAEPITEDFMSALATLLAAVDAYDEWEAEHVGHDGESEG